MDLDGVFAIILFVLHWRVALCIGASSLLATILVNAFPWLTGMQGIGLAALGLAPGAAWHAKGSWLVEPASAGRQPVTQTTLGTACVAAAFAGGAWGALSASSLQSFIAGAIIFALAAKSWAWFARDFNAWVSKDRVVACVLLAAIAYAVTAMLVNFAYVD